MSADYKVINIKSLLDNKDSLDLLSQLLENFECPQNEEVCNFLKKNAIEFAKRKQSITYFVIESSTMSFVGYFTLAVKPIQIKANCLSNRKKDKIERYGKYNESCGFYTISSFLIAQLGKNYAITKENRISGEDLLEIAEGVLCEVQTMIVGGFVFLECEQKKKLTDFYEKNNYRQCGSRISDSENVVLLQYLKQI